MKINVIADIRNMPTKPITEHGYLVARQDITTGHADLWYWGLYEDKDRANQAAVEIRNGVVLEVFGKTEQVRKDSEDADKC